MTGALGRSAFAAALFAVHPLHVESVAWIAERKDVLSTLFWMLSLGAYLRYVDRPSVTCYLPNSAPFALGLMAKPVLVTLPFTLLLLDFWPLGRVASGPPPQGDLPEPVPGDPLAIRKGRIETREPPFPPIPEAAQNRVDPFDSFPPGGIVSGYNSF